MKHFYLYLFVTTSCLLLSACHGDKPTTHVETSYGTATGACKGLLDGMYHANQMGKKTRALKGDGPHYGFSRFGNEAFDGRPTAPRGRGRQGEVRNF